MIVVRWMSVANLTPGDVVASSAPRRAVENTRVLANLGRKLAAGQLPGVVTEHTVLPIVGDVVLAMRVGRVTVRRAYAPSAELAVVSTSETDLDILAKLRQTGTSTATPTGQEA